jgi:hypothetical protein
MLMFDKLSIVVTTCGTSDADSYIGPFDHERDAQHWADLTRARLTKQEVAEGWRVEVRQLERATRSGRPIGLSLEINV